MSTDNKNRQTGGPSTAVLDALKAMTANEIAKSAVSAGIYTTDGKLTEPYRQPKKER